MINLLIITQEREVKGMSGECDECGEHCLDCKCDLETIDWTEFNQKYYDSFDPKKEKTMKKISKKRKFCLEDMPITKTKKKMKKKLKTLDPDKYFKNSKNDLEGELKVIYGEIEDVRYVLETIQDMIFDVTKKIKE